MAKGNRNVTTIMVKKDLWKFLNSQKEPGESMDDVLRRLLGFPREKDEGGRKS